MNQVIIKAVLKKNLIKILTRHIKMTINDYKSMCEHNYNNEDNIIT